MDFKKWLPLLLFIFLSLPLFGQVDFFWENEQIMADRDARFPQVVNSDNEILAVWQEFNEADGTVAFHSISSHDGIVWTSDKVILDPIKYFWEDQVSLFSLVADSSGDFHMAFHEDENTIAVYKKRAGESDFIRSGEILSEVTSLAPRLYEKSDGNLILFSTRSASGGESGLTLTSSLQIIYTEIINGEWTEPAPLITDEELTWNFLPDFQSHDGRDYVVFQSLYTGARITWQIYLLSREAGSTGWSAPKLLTDRDESYEGVSQESIYWDNQRPSLSSGEEGLIMTWERHYSQLSPQIYTARLDRNGDVAGNFTPVTTGYRYNAAPRYFEKDGSQYVLWFDNRDGNQVVMTDLKTTYLGGDRMSRGQGNSSYGIPLIFKGDLYLFWENQIGDRNRLVMLAPDKSVDKPRIEPVSFTLGERNPKSLVTFSWTVPEDSSGIEGYRLGWDRNPDTDPSTNGERLILRPRATTNTADDDGVWYIHISVRDNAGNWSEPLHVPYYRDTTPPSPVVFIRPETDAFGALMSNSPVLAWNSPEDEDLAGYSYNLVYLGNDPFSIEEFDTDKFDPPQRVMTTDRAVKLSNRDDGFWLLAVGSLDKTGNMGKIETLRFRMNKYIPVTYISWVGSSKNREESIVLDIRGRGFAAGGDVVRVLVDKNGQAPWDYEYFVDEDFTVTSDYSIYGPIIDDMREGVYYIGVEHPLRGIVFARNMIKLDATGNVKFGDFTRSFTMDWTLIQDRALRLALNRVSFYLLLAFLLILIPLLALKSVRLWQENRELEINAQALIEGTLMASELAEERMSTMKKQGVGLRAKFTLAFLALVVSIVLLVALVLGNYMITTQQISLGDELEKRSHMMVNTLASGAESYLPLGNRIELSLLPRQTSAMEEALGTTITGKGFSDPDHYNYIWASNKEDIDLYQALPESYSSRDYTSIISTLTEEEESLLESLYQEEEGRFVLNEEMRHISPEVAAILIEKEFLTTFSVGNTPLWDVIEPRLEEVENRINSLASESLADMVRNYDQLNSEATALLLQGGSKDKIDEISETINLLSDQIDESLTAITDQVGILSEPEFNPAELLLLGENEQVFTFYKPVVYQEKGSETYYRGAIRLDVSVGPLISQIKATRRNIFVITSITFAIAIAASILGAFLMASTMIRPIRLLADHVQVIRDTEDKSVLKNKLMEIKSSDELGELGETINQMTLQLAKAAEASKELTVGKDMQKAFIPLEERLVGDSKRKLTTGFKEDGNLVFYGYYEGAKGVSGDYFDYRKLDDEHYAVIKCDIAGKGVSASLIMVEVATLFVSHCREMEPRKGINLPPIIYNINDLLNEVGFQGRFAAFSMMVINNKSGQCVLSHAGDKYFHKYDSVTNKMVEIELGEAPAAGQIDSFLVEMKDGYQQENYKLNSGDIMFMFTDGIEESQRYFRNDAYERIVCDNSCHGDVPEGKEINHHEGEGFEEFGIPRMQDIVPQVMNKGSYELIKYHNPDKDLRFQFDFSTCKGTAEEAVTALVAIEKIFRLHPYHRADPDHTIQVDKKIDQFLRDHFLQYRDYFKHPEEKAGFPEYVYFSHLDEDDQFDDLTILAVEKN
ncbi:MAG: SpoIIE family protein phosphatase [Spirochaetales bacterium]|nr:SpoIIE family protein phosphatase [Spirochaetales bacterium]